MKKRLIVLTAIMGIVALMIVATVLAATEPTYGTAIVDGDYNEWDLTQDFFADMILAGGEGGQTTVLSKLYLRYDCETSTLFALVLATETPTNSIRIEDKEEHWVKINGSVVVDDQSGDNDEAPDFAWVNLSEDIADGWEASAPVDEGTHELKVHTLVWDSEEVQTSATLLLTLTLDCRQTAVQLDKGSFTARWSEEQKKPVHWSAPFLGIAAIAGLILAFTWPRVNNKNP